MNRLVLANIDYRSHMTDEGEQLQAGLAAAGWTLAGHGYGDGLCPQGCRDVAELLKRYDPDVVFVQDPRDWDRSRGGCFNQSVHFENIEALATHPHRARRIVPVKDAGSSVEYQRDFAQQIGAERIVVYYHPRSVVEAAPWLKTYGLVRTYHTIDAALVRSMLGLWSQPRRRKALLSGAVSVVYPLRQRIFYNAHAHGIDVLPHPGYGNGGSRTPGFLKLLAGYRVHICTASRFRFALRKIIESVACGCVCVTNLPAYDRLPLIDEALVRVSEDASMEEIDAAVEFADARWNVERQKHFAELAWGYYDWRAAGQRLSDALTATQESSDAPEERSVSA